MSKGQWVDAWDDSLKRWTQLWVELPQPPGRGTIYTLTTNTPQTPTILGPDGKPVERKADEPRPMGFRR